MENESLDFDMNDSPDASSDDWETEDESTSSEDEVSPLRPSVSHNTNIPEQRQDLTYGCIDPGPKSPIPSFKPARPPGLYLSDEPMTRQDKRKFLTAGAFFRLFFCTEMMVQICKFTNEYAQQHGPNKPYFFKNWQEVTPEELYTFFGLLMYMTQVGRWTGFDVMGYIEAQHGSGCIIKGELGLNGYTIVHIRHPPKRTSNSKPLLLCRRERGTGGNTSLRGQLSTVRELEDQTERGGLGRGGFTTAAAPMTTSVGLGLHYRPLTLCLNP
ncbi:hypothetical protein RRG08_048767 [Elysia crispata]|uniref:PiggyBac transposable element-derived protein domain-containing protein n=1 Tax=Elysia crispata TaxID=231223 RepID=A0AAE1AP12_9GAST|nr:hypothetical protein RRG08_048767 [Elysia crispata]